MKFKKFQRVQWENRDKVYTGVIIQRYLARGFVEMLTLTENGVELTHPFGYCEYPEQCNLRPLETHTALTRRSRCNITTVA